MTIFISTFISVMLTMGFPMQKPCGEMIITEEIVAPKPIELKLKTYKQ